MVERVRGQTIMAMHAPLLQPSDALCGSHAQSLSFRCSNLCLHSRHSLFFIYRTSELQCVTPPLIKYNIMCSSRRKEKSEVCFSCE